MRAVKTFSLIFLLCAGLFPYPGGETPSLVKIPKVPRWHGFELSAGLISFPVLWKLSPMLGAGISRVSSDTADATLVMTAMYLSLGLEWMMTNGLYMGASATLVRSLNIMVAYEYQSARGRTLSVPEFEAFNPGTAKVYQALVPGAVVGYAF